MEINPSGAVVEAEIEEVEAPSQVAVEEKNKVEEKEATRLKDTMEIVRELAPKDNFYPVIVPGKGEVMGKITVAEADTHYGIQSLRDKTVFTMGPQAYLFAVRAKEVARSVTHIGKEPLMTTIGEEAGFPVKEVAPGKADVMFYSGPVPTSEQMEKMKAKTDGAIIIETLPEVDPSDHMVYEYAIQKANLVSGFVGYPGMGFDTGTKGRPALFTARRK